VTAAGESLPSPLSITRTANLYTPPTPDTPIAETNPGQNFHPSALVIGNTYAYKIVFITSTGNGRSLQSAASNSVLAIPSTNDPTKASPIFVHGFSFNLYDSSGVFEPEMVNGNFWYYRSENGGPFLPAGFAFEDGHFDYGSTAGFAYTGSSVATFKTVNLSSVALGPSGVTARKIYQTEAGSAQLKLQQTLANNTATTAVANAADASLGANAPTSDTSGLSTVIGKVLAGSTTLITASADAFSSAGGWAINGQQVIRYTGITSNTLTGIPTSGIGSIINTMLYGEHIDPLPALTGVTGLTSALLLGSPVNVWIQKDDLAAQAIMAALERDESDNPTDGIHEYTITDERIRADTAEQWAETDLSIFALPIVAIKYPTFDVKSGAGKTIPVDLPAPQDYSGSMRIQSVEISEIDVADGKWPQFDVAASSVRFSFEDLIRRAKLI
jgi:hypothetical protein